MFLLSQNKYFVIDEIGKLELCNSKGFINILRFIQENYDKHTNKTIIMVVRKQLVENIQILLREIQITNIEQLETLLEIK